MTRWRTGLLGAVAAVGCAPVAAGLTALVYRFPVPFGEYAHGAGGVLTAAQAALFYLAIGGVLLLAVLGTGAGLLCAKFFPDRTAAWTAAAGFGIALLAAGLLATLEMFIGPW